MKKEQVLKLIDKRALLGVMHRGYHDKEVSENSLIAFKRAVDADMALEFDVHVTKDNELVVIHDEDLKRLTGKEGVVEHLTLKELQENYKLLDGQTIPSLKEVLDLIDEKVPMYIELKVYEKNYKKLTKVFIDFMKDRIKDKSKYIFISFDPRALFPLKKLGIPRLLLVAKSHEYVYNLFRFFFEGVDVEHVLFEEGRIKNYHKKHLVNVWTIEDIDNANELLNYVDTMTFQYIEPKKIKELLNK